MTAHNRYADIYDPQVDTDLDDTLSELEALGRRAATYRIPPESDRTIVAALRQDARRQGQVRDRAKRLSGLTIPGLSRLPSPGLRAVGLTMALLIAISSVLLFGGVANGPTPPASAASVVLRHAARFSIGAGEVAQFTYRLTVAGGHWGPPISSTSRIWVRGRSRLGPEAEAALVEVPPIRVGIGEFVGGYAGYELVIGSSGYSSLNQAGFGPPAPYALFMSPIEQLDIDPIDFVLSHGGAQTARYLQRSLSRGHYITSRIGRIAGRRVDVLTIDHWPGTRMMPANPQSYLQASGPLVLYFDLKTHVLLGMDGRGLEPGAPGRRWRIRLVQEQLTGARKAWAKNLHLMVHGIQNGPAGPGERWTPIMIEQPAVTDLLRVCPGIRRLAADLWAGMGALGTCRTVRPNITPGELISALMVRDRAQLGLAVGEHIFSRENASASLSSLTSELLSGIAATPKARTALIRGVRERRDKGWITREEALNELLLWSEVRQKI